MSKEIYLYSYHVLCEWELYDICDLLHHTVLTLGVCTVLVYRASSHLRYFTTIIHMLIYIHVVCEVWNLSLTTTVINLFTAGLSQRSVLRVYMGDQPCRVEIANPQVSITGVVVCESVLACFWSTGLDCDCHNTFPKFISEVQTIWLNTNTSMANNEINLCACKLQIVDYVSCRLKFNKAIIMYVCSHIHVELLWIASCYCNHETWVSIAMLIMLKWIARDLSEIFYAFFVLSILLRKWEKKSGFIGYNKGAFKSWVFVWE